MSPRAGSRENHGGSDLSRLSAGPVVLLLLFGLSLYLLAPQVIDVLASWPQLSDVAPWWFAAVAAGQVLKSPAR